MIFGSTFFNLTHTHYPLTSCYMPSMYGTKKTVILYIVAKSCSWMAFLTPTCNSEGKLGVFPETASHQIIEFLKRSEKCLNNLVHSLTRTCIFLWGGTHWPYCQSPISCIIRIASGWDKNVEVNLWGKTICDTRHMYSLKSIIHPQNHQTFSK